jgi:hypothetical protein
MGYAAGTGKKDDKRHVLLTEDVAEALKDVSELDLVAAFMQHICATSSRSSSDMQARRGRWAVQQSSTLGMHTSAGLDFSASGCA